MSSFRTALRSSSRELLLRGRQSALRGVELVVGEEDLPPAAQAPAVARGLPLADPEEPAPHGGIRAAREGRIERGEPAVDAAQHLLLHVRQIAHAHAELRERAADELAMFENDSFKCRLFYRHRFLRAHTDLLPFFKWAVLSDFISESTRFRKNSWLAARTYSVPASGRSRRRVRRAAGHRGSTATSLVEKGAFSAAASRRESRAGHGIP